LQGVGGTRKVAPSALGKRPASAAASVQRDIDRRVVERIAPARPGIVGRKDAPDEGDQRERFAAIVT
jgi:hypothetical protein